MAKTRELVRTVENTVDEDVVSDDERSSEGWVDPTESSPIQAPLEESPLNDMTLAELATFDPHMYAMRKSKNAADGHYGRRKKRQTTEEPYRKSSKRVIATDASGPKR